MKLSQKAKKRIQGSISILLILILVPMMAFIGVIVDTSRINMAKSMISSGGDLALNSALANYDTILKDVYGLFAMSQHKSKEEQAEDIKNYFVKTVTSQGVVPADKASDYVQSLFGDFNELLNGNYSDNISNLMKMDMDSSSIVVTPLANSTLANPDIMRKQIVEYMKYRGPVNIGMGFFDALKSFESVEDQSKVVEKKVEAEEAVQDTTDACKKAIDDIRAFDKKLEEINSTNAIRGVQQADDGKILTVSNYSYQLAHYVNRSIPGTINTPDGSQISHWFMDYTSIRELYEVFVQKAPVTNNMKLVMLAGAGGAKPLIVGSADNWNLTTEDTKITVPSKNTSNAETDFNAKINEQSTHLSTLNTYVSKAANFPTNDLAGKMLAYVCYDYRNLNTIAASVDIDAIEEAYIQYEHFILNDGQAGINYSDVEKAITYLYELKRDYENYLKAIDKEAEEPKKVVSKLDGIKTDIDFLKSYDDEMQKLEDALETAKNANPQSQTAIDAAQRKIDEYAAKKTKCEGNIKKAGYEDLATNPGNYDSTYQAAVDAVNSVLAKKDTAYANYSAVLKKFVNPTNKYIENLKAYDDIMDYVMRYIDFHVSDISKQFKQIKTNLNELKTLLTNINKDLDAVVTAVSNYDTKVGEWATANNTYVTNNSSDSFSMSNSMDIDEAKSSISVTEVKKLKDYIDGQQKKITDFITHIEDPKTYIYAGKKIYDITGASVLYNDSTKKAFFDNSKAVVVDKYFPLTAGELVASEDPVTTEGKYFDAGLSDTMYLLKTKDPVSGLEQYNPARECTFLSYLNATYPDKSDQTAEDKQAEADYESFKSNVSSDNNGKSVDDLIKDTEASNKKLSEDGSKATETDKFGYTYKSADSAILSASSSKSTTNEAAKGTLKINTSSGKDGKKVDASSGLKEQTSGISSILKGIDKVGTVMGNVASTALEDMYILQYIFDNFSYNTIVQDRIVKKEKADTISSIALVNDKNKIAIAQKEIKTLSNYTIGANNNYLNGAEIEYILYGNTNASTNVTNVKASIYAIRMVFNSIYAFTNSEIRNTTRAAGLAVQTATCGIVPYQVVMIVLQLALAAAESGVDLTAMGNGIKVAVVKTSETWTLSVSNALKAAGDAVGTVLSNAAAGAIDKVNEGIQGVLDASAEQLSGKIDELTGDVSAAINDKVQGVVNRSFDYVEAQICGALSKLQQTDFGEIVGNAEIPGKDDINKKIDEIFKTEVEDKIPNILTNCFKDAPALAEEIYNASGNAINNALIDVVNKVKEGLKSKIDSALSLPNNTASVSSLVSDAINSSVIELKQTMLNTVNEKIAGLSDTVKGVADKYIKEAHDQLGDYAKEATSDLKEEATSAIKDKVNNYTNSFIDEYITHGTGPVEVDYEPSGKGSAAELVKFGYKEYLMMFVFLKIIIDDGDVLSRTGDVIEFKVK